MGEQRSNKEILGFDDTWFLILGIPVLAFCIPFLFFKATLADGLMAYLPEWGISMMYTTAYWMSCRTIFIYFRRRFPGQQETRKRLLYVSASVLAAYTVVNWSLDYVHIFMGHEEREGVTEFDYTVGTLMIVALVSTLYESAFLYDRWKRTIVEAEQLKRENIESQLEGLKSQVNPHFLFNSLNTLSYIIPEDPVKAVQFVQKLSKAYRYILEIRDKKLISLEEELNFLQAYLFLVQERFGDNLRADIQVSDEVLPTRLVPLSLQILFENAVKHNIISEERPLHIELWVENNRLIVRNNLQRKRQALPSTNLGLQNIKNRYAFFSEEKVDVIETTEYFTVSIPLITAPVGVGG
ncbi:MAG: histidine kinase [Lewinellaceae bacterium]|nr:histidine kinase [Phaeodactylibacter sp.]MCB0612356.1 histidine kinase [Phaeodactylibacter sp.]MCB9347073.1 histidine kinase [Lewinellaceae bacterium]